MSCFANHSPSHLSTYKVIVVQSTGRSFIGGGRMDSISFFMTSSFDIFISGFSRHPRGLFLANKIKAKFLLIAVAVPKASLVAVQAVAANTSKRRGAAVILYARSGYSTRTIL
jgi:hypothetical protein